MGIRHFITPLILLISLASTKAINIEIKCIYKADQSPWEIIKDPKFKTCELQTDLKSTDVIVEALSDTATITKADVEIFVVNSRDIVQIPEGLKAVFPKLIGIDIDTSNFRLLDAESLKILTGLKYLAITNSKIDVIFADTFKDLTLELIDLSANPLLFISEGVFDGPGAALKYLYLEVLCLMESTSMSATDSAALTTLKADVDKSCTDYKQLEIALFSTTKKFIASSELTECEPCGNEEECPIDCTEELNTLNSTLNTAKEGLATCTKKTTDLNADILKLEQKVEELEALTSIPSDGTCGFKTVSGVYSCYAKLTVRTAAEQTVNWTGKHESSKTNDAVLSMVIYSQTVEILPLNIGTAFKNLKSLAVKNSGLTKIKAGDFKSLTKLETLEISGNNIATIDDTAFSGLTALSKIDLSANKLTALPSKVFDALPKLSIINLSDNDLKVRYDVINASNNIAEVYLMNNRVIVPLDKTFIWRLQKAQKIDLSGTECTISLDKTQPNHPTFMTFYSDIVSNC